MNKRDFLKMSARAATLIPVAAFGANRGLRYVAVDDEPMFLPSVDAGTTIYYVGDSGADSLLLTQLNASGVWAGSGAGGHSSPFGPTYVQAYPRDDVTNAYLAYVGVNGNELLLTSSDDGIHFGSSYGIGGQSSKAGPALAMIGDSLLLAYVANNSSNDLLVTLSKNLTIAEDMQWGLDLRTGQSSKFSPSLSYLGEGDTIFMAYVANNDGNALLVSTSSDGTSWNAPTEVSTNPGKVAGQSSKTAPSLCSFLMPKSGTLGVPALAMAYVANNDSNQLLLTTSTDGYHWSNPILVGGQSSEMAPALSTNGGGSLNPGLVLAYVASNGSNDLYVTTPGAGTTWSTGVRVGSYTSKAAPCIGYYIPPAVLK